MKLLRNLPIKRKLTLIMMLTSCIALLLACIAFVIYEQVVFRSSMVGDVLTTGKMIGDNSSAALSFKDPSSAEQTLKSLNAHPHITGAAVYDKEGKLFAMYQGAGAKTAFSPPLAEPAGYRFGDNRLQLFHKIELAGETAGTVYIESNLDEMRARLWRYGLIVVIVLIATSLVAFLLSTRLQRVISEPIAHLAHVANIVALEKNYSVRAIKSGDDELGRLIAGFNEMLIQIQERDWALQIAREDLERRVEERTGELKRVNTDLNAEILSRQHAQEQLEVTHRRLLETSRQAGMAEVATSVLHNVGNVLNSVNVSSRLISQKIKMSKPKDLHRVTALLREHSADLGAFLSRESKGQQLIAYLDELGDHLGREQNDVLTEVQSLEKNIEHINDIVAMQQSYAKVSGVTECVQLAELAEDALRLNSGALARHDITLVREYDEVPPINTERHKVLQILVNLVRNAKYACDESGRSDKRLTVRLSHTNGGLNISVADNGVGIPRENLTRIFNHGFTTRRDGHGFGLHSGALAARELGGALTVHSDGPGCGATFTLELPIQL